jgi:photosystem II stability/assembly factor-like uncharacterized protein
VKCLPIAVSTSATLYAVSFAAGDIAIAAGASGTLLRSTNSGRSWDTRAVQTDSTVFALAFAGPVGIAVGRTLLRTEDAGETWTQLSPLGQEVLGKRRTPLASCSFVVLGHALTLVGRGTLSALARDSTSEPAA